MIEGIVVINKKKGYTSHDIVSKAKKILDAKVGHTGTLDPNATGVLPLLIGQGTKLSYYLIEHDKEYVVTLKLGSKTDTADCEGKIIEQQEVKNENLSRKNIEKVLNSFLGKQQQIPPIYSAIKVNGKKLYEYARKSETVEIKPREIQIYQIELIEINLIDTEIIFKVKCSKGTYIRSLCEDIANKLETVGYMKELQRTVVGNFNIANSITIEELEKNKDNKEFLEQHIISIEDFFKNQYKENEIKLNDKKIKLFLNGVQLTYNLKEDLYRIYNEEKEFVGIGVVKNNLLKREIIVEN